MPTKVSSRRKAHGNDGGVTKRRRNGTLAEQTEYAGQVAAINRSQAVIEFELDGTIITANDNFLSFLGYSLAEIQGRHHSLFVDA